MGAKILYGILFESSISQTSLFGMLQFGSISPDMSMTKHVLSFLWLEEHPFSAVALQKDRILGMAMAVVFPAPEAAQTKMCPSLEASL